MSTSLAWYLRSVADLNILWLAAVATAVAMVSDWWAVRADRVGVEQVAKPAVMVALIGLALTVDADPEVARWLVVAGLFFGLAGDVFLLPSVDRFLYGLGAFLIGHGFYIAAFATMDLVFIGVVGGFAAAIVLLTYLGRPTIRKVWGGPLAVPVIAYMVIVGALVVMGTATHRWPIAAGGVLFALSDGLLGLDRFVTPAPQRRVVVHMLYHLGQAGLVVGLAWF
jgi:alkenylglycerophosphocholine/alkenylglycerophosphoethanolamine hydrolase